MKDWMDKLFHEYQCDKKNNHYVLAKNTKNQTVLQKDATDRQTRTADKTCVKSAASRGK